jgi:alpha-N-arabinofuranosidase
MLQLFIVVCLIVQGFYVKVHADLNATLTVDASQASGRRIPDTLFGIFFEVRMNMYLAKLQLTKYCYLIYMVYELGYYLILIAENNEILEFDLQEINHAGAGGLWAELVSNRGHSLIL